MLEMPPPARLATATAAPSTRARRRPSPPTRTSSALRDSGTPIPSPRSSITEDQDAPQRRASPRSMSWPLKNGRGAESSAPPAVYPAACARQCVRRSVIEHAFVLLRGGVDVVAATHQHMECTGCVQVAGGGVVEEVAAPDRGDGVGTRRPAKAGDAPVRVEAGVGLLAGAAQRAVVQATRDKRVPARYDRRVLADGLDELRGVGGPPCRRQVTRAHVDLRVDDVADHTSPQA